MLRSQPPTRINASRPLSANQAQETLHTFIHFTGVTRPLRNRRLASSEGNVFVLPFSPSVLNNLKRIEMGLRGEYVRPEPPSPSSFSHFPRNKDDSKKGKIDLVEGDEQSTQGLLPEMDENAYGESGLGGRETDHDRDGEVVADPTFLTHPELGPSKKKGKKRKRS